MARRDLPLLAHSGPLFRIYRMPRDPEFWGRTGDHRFDAPDGEFGVLYAATDEHGAFAETCGDTLDGAVTTDFLAQRGWARIELARPLRLIDLTGPGLVRLGADERLCAGDHDVSQQWSLALWKHPAAVDGLCYRARRDPSRMSVALFDRAAPAIAVVRAGALLDDRHAVLLAGILDTYQLSLL